MRALATRVDLAILAQERARFTGGGGRGAAEGAHLHCLCGPLKCASSPLDRRLCQFCMDRHKQNIRAETMLRQVGAAAQGDRVEERNRRFFGR